MAYKWKPNASQRKAFAQRMQNPEEKAAYEQSKRDKAEKRRSSSQFEYETAGGNYKPTQHQYLTAMKMLKNDNLSMEQSTAASVVIFGYSCNDKVHHDYIHIVNEWGRSNNF